MYRGLKRILKILYFCFVLKLADVSKNLIMIYKTILPPHNENNDPFNVKSMEILILCPRYDEIVKRN
jgi:hypothetical protein